MGPLKRFGSPRESRYGRRGNRPQRWISVLPLSCVSERRRARREERHSAGHAEGVVEI